MHRVGSAGNTSGSTRPRKEKRLTYVLNDADQNKHCAGVNCLTILKSTRPDECDYLFTGSRDGTLKRWSLTDNDASCSATFESHTDWVADAVLIGNILVSCSSDTTVKTWNCLSDGICTKTFRQHSDYVTCLTSAEKNNNIFASGGLGGEVFIWDIEAAFQPVAKSVDTTEEELSNGNTGLQMTTRSINTSNNLSICNTQSHGYCPMAAKGHKDSVYALAMNDSGTVLASGGTEKVVRIWDPRTGSKNTKLKGHTENIRALLLDSTGRFCLSGSSDSMIRLWDIGMQRCVHSYAVHTDSVWALASSPTFTHVYSGGRDQSLYLTDLSSRESLLLFSNEHPILKMTVQDDNIWLATTDSSVHRLPAGGHNPRKVFERGGSFLAGGNLSFSRARASLEGSAPVAVHKEPSCSIPGIPGIVQHEILNNRRHVLTKDTAGSVKLWEITRGVVIEDYGKVSFDEKKEELFEMVSIPSWFTIDTRLGCLSIHLEAPQCFSAEMYAMDLNISEASEDRKINLAQETLRGLMSHWLNKRRQRPGSQTSSNDDVPSVKDVSVRNPSLSKVEMDDGAENSNLEVLSSFEFSTVSPPSIITEGSHGGPWRKKIIDLDGTEDEKDLPLWCMDCVLNGRLPARENTKCSFHLQACEGSTPLLVVTQGKLSAPRILRINKVVNYVTEKIVLGKSLDGGNPDGSSSLGLSIGGSHFLSVGDGSFRAGTKLWPKLKPAVEILCNNQVLSPDMSLATVRTYIWKKPEDLVLNYRVLQTR